MVGEGQSKNLLSSKFKPSNLNLTLRIYANAPINVSNCTLHTELKIEETAKNYSALVWKPTRTL